MCYLSLPTIQMCVEKWHQNHQPIMQGCQTPNKCPAFKPPSPKSGSCQACISWGKAVESKCFPLGKPIQWKNVNATLLHKDPVEVAKGFVFIIPDGQNCTDFGDFDIGGILKLMMGFVDYHGGDQVCYDKMKKVLIYRTLSGPIVVLVMGTNCRKKRCKIFYVAAIFNLVSRLRLT